MLSTDLYQFTMAAGYHAAQDGTNASFELFVRELPSSRNYLVTAGLEQALSVLAEWRYTRDEIQYLRSVPALRSAGPEFFDEYLARLRFSGEVWAMAEGTPVFAGEPILRVTAPLEEAQLVETALLSTVLFQTSVASKAARVTDAAAGRPVMEFGGRRAHGVDAALLASRAAYLGGCSATSNVEAGYRFGIPVAGTMAHSWVMAHCDELTAFERDMALHGSDSVLLIDTYNSVTAAQKIVSAGLRPAAVRIDSGDLARVSVVVRSIFDAGPLSSTRILVSGDLDEHRVAALVASGAPIDGFGVGTALSTSVDAPALGGVYKLVEILREGTVTPVAKRSLGKQTLPGRKQVWRVGESSTAVYDVVGLATETAPSGGVPLLECVMRDGRRTGSAPRLCELRAACTSTRLTIPESVRRLSAPGPYPVTFSAALVELARKNRVEVARSGAPRDIG